ncbi:hypothetical protein GCM10007938_42200 [Vibrio zhanjiangensis]|uniref:Uncharacterized protein n=1 Tax=Vibrio zhanjiangensis TaxID=1046128 RepID=A0ABQ6F759_9VIBR|nr:hypothetical protein [Vibrio zhanjiangensis]GLT20435.1 hypothetical protein GCM10007938_42200 [Vibrio zhanjiangensis]
MKVISKAKFDKLANANKVVATGFDSDLASYVTVIGNENGTPIAITYQSKDSDFEPNHFLLPTLLGTRANY